ncbi:ABC transporter ATP-binding protein [Natrinema zhouii]|uniref:ABC transporter ATP-binding protein n=1 Tax=Natrinema zhouii TaxID=1710539 RepID=A0A7D6H573_9EURY|nr:ABC transporter ATP-binding protein [Natrinema zhouii]QLK25448.1 ABC transporter ATP-binding protein [Natrinema zhouii]
MTVLEIDDIDTYYGNSHILHDVSLDLAEGEVVALLGRNGAGKTTTMRSIMGVTPPQRGSIRYRGEELVGKSPDEINELGLNLVPEDRRVFPTLTVHENIVLAHKLADDPRPVEEMYDLFPVLDDLRSNNGQNLSGGEQQMLSVARALIQRPSTLLLDEPTEGLAPVIVDDLREMLQDVVDQNVTVLLSEQNVNFAFDLATRGYVIDTGSIVFEGSIEDIRERDDLLEKYLAVSPEEVA